MGLASFQSASPTIGTTEYSMAAASTTLASETTDGMFQATLDLNALTHGDLFEVALYEMGVAGGTKRVVERWQFAKPQARLVTIMPAFILGNGWDWTLKKVSGTDRAIPFTLWKGDGVTSYASASPTIGTTEYSFAAASTTLPTKTDLGAYQLTVDLNAVAAGDQFLFQQYEAGVASGTKRLADSMLVTGVPNDDGLLLLTPVVILGRGWDWTVKKLAGTDRALPFTLWKVA